VVVIEVATEIGVALKSELVLGSHCRNIEGSIMSLEYEVIILGLLDISEEVLQE
jgi:hypothetical protein